MDAPFVFDPRAPRHKVSDETILAALAEFARVHNNAPFGKRDFDKWVTRPCSTYTIVGRFGGWNRALRRAGIDAPLSGLQLNDHLMTLLEKAWRTLRHPPGGRSLKKLVGVEDRLFRFRWGSLKHACERLALFHEGKLTRHQLISPSRAVLLRRSLTASMRFSILERDGYKCVACGRSSREAKLEVDHIIPLSKGGSNDTTNLRALCVPCNRGKGSRHKGAICRGGSRAVPNPRAIPNAPGAIRRGGSRAMSNPQPHRRRAPARRAPRP